MKSIEVEIQKARTVGFPFFFPEWDGKSLEDVEERIALTALCFKESILELWCTEDLKEADVTICVRDDGGLD